MAEADGRRVEAPATAPTETALPQVFGRYLLLRRLSRGGMGEIFLAKLGEIQGFEKLVIIKKVLPHLAADGEFIKRFIDEAQVAIKLNHGNVAPVFEVGRVDGEYFLAIAYIEGRDLRRTVSRLRESKRRLSPDLALYVAREVAAGLAYAHRRNDDDGHSLELVHCDISPPNVMLSFEGEVKIIDFGISRSSIRLAESNPNMGFGKFGYMAPEQLLRGGVIDKRTDLYAVGVILYELLTGERMVPSPEGGDYRSIARAVTQGKFPRPSERNPAIPPELDTLVMKAIAVKPEARYQTGESLRDAIQTELARLNPTISGDELAAVLRDLFYDELTEERELLAHMREVDLAPFREELTTATVAHTVTFARASAEASSPADTEARAGQDAVPASPLSSMPLLASSETSAPILPAPYGGRRLALLAFVAMLGGAGAMLLYARSRSLPPVVQLQPSPPTAPPATPALVPVPVVVQAPVVTPIPREPSVQPEDHHQKRPRRSVEPIAAARTPEAVQAKFQQVRGEYSSFKGQYGGVLEDRWNAVANEITFGKSDKVERVDQLLDALRRDMARVRDGK